jgi:ribosomal-protein-alanine N-acetyltransferase
MLIVESNIKMLKKEKFNFIPFPELKTERLILRQLKESDSQDIFYLRTDEGNNRYIDRPRPKSIDDAKEFILETNNGIMQNEWIYWVVTLKNKHILVGTICLWNLSEDKTKAEVGFELKPEHQGKGIMSEALVKVLEFGFKRTALATIDAYTHYDNISSIKLLEKNGFKRNTELQDSENPNNIIFTRTL